MKAIHNLDELRRDPHPIACSSNTSLENMVDVEPPADLAEFDVFSTKEEGGRAAATFMPGTWANTLIISLARPSPKYRSLCPRSC